MLKLNVSIEIPEIAVYFFEKMNILVDYFPNIDKVEGYYNCSNTCLQFSQDGELDFTIMGQCDDKDNYICSMTYGNKALSFDFHPRDGMGDHNENQFRKNVDVLHKNYINNWKKR